MKDDLPTTDELLTNSILVFPALAIIPTEITHRDTGEKWIAAGLAINTPELPGTLVCALSQEMIDELIASLEEFRELVTFSASVGSVKLEEPSVN